MNSNLATNNLCAVSAALRETGINVNQTIDLALQLSMNDVNNITPRRESDENEANGMVEASRIYDNGGTSVIPMTFEKAQPHHFAFLYAFGLGSCVTTASGTGHMHTITPITRGIDRARDLPSFSMLQRLGETVLKRKLTSMFVDSITSNFPADGWVNIQSNIIGTGKYEDNVVEEEITAPANTEALTLGAGNAVYGSTAEDRLDSLQQIRVELTAGVWTEVVFSAASADTPTEITITAPSADAGNVSYKVLYRKTEDSSWNIPATLVQSSLRVSEMDFTLGGTWDGSDFLGGRVVSEEILSVSHSLTNSGKLLFPPGAGGAFAGRYENVRSQKFTIDKQFYDIIIQNHLKKNDTLGCHIISRGPIYEVGKYYQVELIFPKLGILSAVTAVNEKKLKETVELQVLQDATHGSVIVKVQEIRAAGYAQ